MNVTVAQGGAGGRSGGTGGGVSGRVLVLSDIHYAGPGERQRPGFEVKAVGSWPLRLLVRAYRRYVWLPDPLAYHHLLGEALERCGDAEWVVANGDYSCDSAFVGVSDDAACESARLVLERLRGRFGERLLAVLGDHELGKTSLVGGRGGFRLASWRRATGELGIEPFWMRRQGRHVLMGVTSSLLGFPVYEPESLAEERSEWWRLREEHLGRVREAFAGLDEEDRVVLFVHDPTALPYLEAEPAVASRLAQVTMTVIGHLHSPLILGVARLLAGMPEVGFMGNAVRRMSRALSRASCWRRFRVVLCPALAGIELRKDGGWLELGMGPENGVEVVRHRLPR